LKIKLNIRRERKADPKLVAKKRAAKQKQIINRRFVVAVDDAGKTKRMQLTAAQKKAMLHLTAIKKFPLTPSHKKALKQVKELDLDNTWFDKRKIKKNPIRRLLNDLSATKQWIPRSAKGIEYVQMEKELKFTKGGLAFFNKHKVLFVNRMGIAVRPMENQILACYIVKNRKTQLKLDFTQMSLGTIRVLINDIRNVEMRNANALFVTKRYRTILNNTGYVEGKTIRDCLSYIDFSKLTRTKVVVSWFAFFNQGDETIRVSNAFTSDPDDIKVQVKAKGRFPIEMREGEDVNKNQFMRFMGAIRRNVERDIISSLLGKGYTFTSLTTIQDFVERDKTLGYESPELSKRIKQIKRGDIKEFGLEGFRFGIKFEKIPDEKMSKTFRRNSIEFKEQLNLYRENLYYGVKMSNSEFEKELRKRIRNAKKGGKNGKAEKSDTARVSEERVTTEVIRLRDSTLSRPTTSGRERVPSSRIQRKRVNIPKLKRNSKT